MNPELPKSKFTGIWIPAEVWSRKDLSITEKALYGCVHALGGFTESGCFASNKFLADRFGVSQGGIANMISAIRKAGLIHQTHATGTFRQLWLKQPSLPQPKPLPQNSALDPSSTDEGGVHLRMKGGSSTDEGSPAPHICREKRIEKEERNGAVAPPPGFSGIETKVLEAWNKSGLPKALAVTGSRQRALSKRVKEPFFRDNYEAAIEMISNSDFCKGQNDRGWKANFDFFLRPGTVVKTLEGAYKNKTHTVEEVDYSGWGKPCNP